MRRLKNQIRPSLGSIVDCDHCGKRMRPEHPYGENHICDVCRKDICSDCIYPEDSLELEDLRMIIFSSKILILVVSLLLLRAR